MQSSKIYIVGGAGIAPKNLPLLSFDRALRDAKCGDLNLCRLTSVVPPNAKLILDKEPPITPGKITHAVYSYKTTQVPGEVISCCLAWAIPTTTNKPHSGVFFEVSGAMPRQEAIDCAIQEAKLAMKDRGFLDLVEDHVSVTATGIPGQSITVICLALFI